MIRLLILEKARRANWLNLDTFVLSISLLAFCRCRRCCCLMLLLKLERIISPIVKNSCLHRLSSQYKYIYIYIWQWIWANHWWKVGHNNFVGVYKCRLRACCLISITAFAASGLVRFVTTIAMIGSRKTVNRWLLMNAVIYVHEWPAIYCCDWILCDA